MLNKLSTLRNRGVSEEGFTLIELIIVVVIIGILSAIAIPIFMNQQKSAVAAGVKSDVRNTNTNIATALAKDPTAATISGAHAYDDTAVQTITVGATTADFVVSDDNTNITVAAAGSDPAWQGYTVTGSNEGLDGDYVFNSAEGTYEGSGELA